MIKIFNIDKPSQSLDTVTFIVDFSGSVGSHIKNMGEKIFDAITASNASSFNVIWFSGEKEFGYLFKDYQKTFSKELFVSKFRTVGLTSFVGPLELFLSSTGNTPNSLMVFITDGEPVVRDVAAHDKKCEDIATKITSNALWIAVGQINLDFFKRMAEITGGAIEHFDMMQEALSYFDNLKDFGFNKILLPDGFDVFYEVVDGRPVIVNGNTVMTDTVFGVKFDEKPTQTEIAVALKAGKIQQLQSLLKNRSKHLELLLAQNLTSIARDGLANDLFSGDIKLKSRFKTPSISIFELLNKLVESKVVIDRKKTFDGYKRNSSKTNTEDNDGWSFDDTSTVSDIVYNKERLNVNLGMSILGIKATPNEKDYESKSLYKLYTIIQDGVIKVKKIYVLSDSLQDWVLSISDYVQISEGYLIIDLTSFPIIRNDLKLRDGEIHDTLSTIIYLEEFLKAARNAKKALVGSAEVKEDEVSLPKEKKVYTDSYEVETLSLELDKDLARQIKESIVSNISSMTFDDLVNGEQSAKTSLNGLRAKMAEIRAICGLNSVEFWQGVAVKRAKKVVKI